MLAIFAALDFRTRLASLGVLLFSLTGLHAGGPTTFEVKVVGSGPPVILIPGLSCSGAIWEDTVKHLQDRYQCHILSIKGFGGTDRLHPLPQPLLPAVRDEIIAYGRTLGHPAIVGHSLGGVLAMSVAVEAPDLPRALVIVDSTPFLAGGLGADPDAAAEVAATIQKRMEGLSQEDFASTQALVIRTMVNSEQHAEALSALAGRSDQATVSQALAELLKTDLREELSRIRCPVLVILAGINAAALSEDAREKSRGQYAALEGVRVLFFEKARHFIMYDEPENFFSELDGALGGS